jgi:hypothetical protein
MMIMIKHWRLFDDITEEQIKQLQDSDIFVRVETDVDYFDVVTAGIKNYSTIKRQDVFIGTTVESQETILHLLFPGKVKLIGYDYDYEH